LAPLQNMDKSAKDRVTRRRDEILAALDEPNRLSSELEQIDKRLEALDDEEGRTTVYTFRGIARKEGGRLVGKTLVEVTEGNFVEMPHMMFEQGLGRGATASATSRCLRLSAAQRRVRTAGRPQPQFRDPRQSRSLATR
jgi:hypothetical protein